MSKLNKDEIIAVLKELYKITGLRASLHGEKYEEIAAYPQTKLSFCQLIQSNRSEYEMCRACDMQACRKVLKTAETMIYECRYGLTEAISPLYNFGKLTGFLMMGQVLSEGKSQGELYGKLIEMGYPSEVCDSTVREIPVIRQDMIESYVKIMTICARYLTLSNSIPSTTPTVAEGAKRFIDEHYSEHISINDVCREVGCSKSTLLSAFKSRYGMTVNVYLNDVRIAKARKLLEGDTSINEIAGEVGFSDQSYFSKVFLSKEGVSPTAYRKSVHANTLSPSEALAL